MSVPEMNAFPPTPRKTMTRTPSFDFRSPQMATSRSVHRERHRVVHLRAIEADGRDQTLDRKGDVALAQPTSPAARICATSPALNPSSCKISSVCSPRSGG